MAQWWFPAAGIVAKIIEKTPMERFEIYVRERARDGRLQVTKVAGLEASAIAGSPGSGDGAPPVAAAQQAPPGPTVLDVNDLLRQYKEVRESEPFLVALGSNSQEAVEQLETFMQETALFSGNQRETSNGLWPAFALEWKVRRVLANRLGDAAIVADHPALQSLIEADLAAGLVDTLMAAPVPTLKQPRTLDRLVRVFKTNASDRWSKAAGFRPGFVVANVAKPLSLRTLKLNSVVGQEALARQLGADAINETQANQDMAVFNDRFARLSNCGRDELTRAWLRSCAVSELSQQQRKASGTAPNPFLSRLKHPLIHIYRADLLEEIRDDVEASIGLPVTTDQSDDSLYAQLDALTDAYATHDPAAFDRAAATVAASLILPSNSAIAERVGRVIERLKHAREWK
jgi:hypothetical protein